MLSEEQRKARARLGALSLHAQGGTNTRSAFAARMARLETQVDPDRSLAPDVRARRVRQALKAQMARLNYAAAAARTKKKATPVSETSGVAQEARRATDEYSTTA